MNKEQSDKYVESFIILGVNKPCARCSSKYFTVISESETPISLPDITNNKSPLYIPTVLTACSGCGYIIQHAKSILDGAIDEENEEYNG